MRENQDRELRVKERGVGVRERKREGGWRERDSRNSQSVLVALLLSVFRFLDNVG